MAEKSASTKRIRTVTSSRSGRPSIDKTAALSKKHEKAEDAHNMDYLQMREGIDARWAGTEDKRSNRFPVRLFPKDPYDDVARLKSAAADDLGVKTLTTDDLEYLRRKEESIQGADFKTWIIGQFDNKDPAQREMFMRTFGEIVTEQESIIDHRAELSARLAKMALRGPASKEDYEFLYLLNTGRIELPTGELWDPKKWNSAGEKNAILKRGMFNPNKVRMHETSGQNRVWNALQANTGGRTSGTAGSASTFMGGLHSNYATVGSRAQL